MNSPSILRLSSILAGLALTLLLAGWIVPLIQFSNASQFDFWLVWLLCMVILALPFGLLEVALANRTRATPLPALMVLTREADAKPGWRLTGWLAAIVMALIGGKLLYQSAAMIFGSIHHTPAEAMNYLPVLTMLAGLALSFLSRQLLIIIATIAVVVATGLSLLHVGLGNWQWTVFSLKEWGWAVSLALIATGLGMGVYWQLNASRPVEHASATALPIWLAQIVGGLLLALAQGYHGNVALWLYSAGLLAGGAFLLSLLREQLQARSLSMLLQWLLIAAGLLVWLIPLPNLLTSITVILALLVCLLYAVFSGWMMKISHLRKSLNFRQEAVYNLWRVAVRIVIPLAVIVAIIGLILPA
ncbi:hypothetical protein ACF3NA_02580 [Alkanindiges sp. WGS2144]|uniref:hypothetical protein n=1 Tax=Alkanindiges sp. WGS2144 TaxID=3366808 RepID=UPI0037539255